MQTDTAERVLLRRESERIGRAEPATCATPRPCLMCGKQLAGAERKVHAGACARARDTELQRKRRLRWRIARPAPGERRY